ncbi:unnamed protein product [Didymodactylos carnosus]|uniref:Uncharacterized protein n=1 Tax=Didymodactylos carnosus TaxID=1234261 RepID=A0A814G7S4_9BILA|nr:unnamed protein product [Didymodactylos carnosus]CAF0991140.1 unnamed protein product [Didymodactylos carnosus]CAF3506709.1 unnamed protein product [Didymodactylos carnosus]CAF3763091.1 unnamed protein product [Didymodactylos carnosus]
MHKTLTSQEQNISSHFTRSRAAALRLLEANIVNEMKNSLKSVSSTSSIYSPSSCTQSSSSFSLQDCQTKNVIRSIVDELYTNIITTNCENDNLQTDSNEQQKPMREQSLKRVRFLLENNVIEKDEENIQQSPYIVRSQLLDENLIEQQHCSINKLDNENNYEDKKTSTKSNSDELQKSLATLVRLNERLQTLPKLTSNNNFIAENMIEKLYNVFKSPYTIDKMNSLKQVLQQTLLSNVPQITSNDLDNQKSILLLEEKKIVKEKRKLLKLSESSAIICCTIKSRSKIDCAVSTETSKQIECATQTIYGNEFRSCSKKNVKALVNTNFDIKLRRAQSTISLSTQASSSTVTLITYNTQTIIKSDTHLIIQKSYDSYNPIMKQSNLKLASKASSLDLLSTTVSEVQHFVCPSYVRSCKLFQDIYQDYTHLFDKLYLNNNNNNNNNNRLHRAQQQSGTYQIIRTTLVPVIVSAEDLLSKKSLKYSNFSSTIYLNNKIRYMNDNELTSSINRIVLHQKQQHQYNNNQFSDYSADSMDTIENELKDQRHSNNNTLHDVWDTNFKSSLSQQGMRFCQYNTNQADDSSYWTTISKGVKRKLNEQDNIHDPLFYSFITQLMPPTLRKPIEILILPKNSVRLMNNDGLLYVHELVLLFLQNMNKFQQTLICRYHIQMNMAKSFNQIMKSWWSRYQIDICSILDIL